MRAIKIIIKCVFVTAKKKGKKNMTCLIKALKSRAKKENKNLKKKKEKDRF